MKLNPEQQEAVDAGPGAWLCLATAGAGKTFALTERIRRLLRDGEQICDILALTFTVAAAENMAQRLNLKISKTEKFGFRTFHSLGLRIIQEEHRLLPYGLSENPIPPPQILSKLLTDAMAVEGTRRELFKDVRGWISNQKRKRVAPADATGPYADIYEIYEKRLHDGGLLDYDSMIVEAVNILEKDSGARDRWQFKWVLCDEGQDTDDLQFRLLQLVSQRDRNVFVVGDFCQALYGFRGANPENLLDFARWFPDAKTLILPTNYRSTSNIVAFCRGAAPVDNELTRNMRTDNPEGKPVEFRMYGDSDKEADGVLAAAQADPGSSAILARTNQQLAIFETKCVEQNLRFFSLGKSGFWHQSEVKNIVHLANFVLSTRPPGKYWEQVLYPLGARIRSLPAGAAIKMILERSGIESLYASTEYQDEDNYALLNLQALVRIADRFATLKEFASHARKAVHASRKSKNAITLGTIHSAKGLEYRNVFVVGVQEGKLPHERGELDEEARVFFVACSRAAERLRLTFSGTPSRFINKYLTPEIRSQLEKYSNEVENLNAQHTLF